MSAPQVTPAMVEAAIASEHYFTGQDGSNGAHVRATGGDMSLSTHDPLTVVQFCVLVLKNGHLVTGEALLQDLSKPDPERARASARRRAFDKAYDMVVYAERERLLNAAVRDALRPLEPAAPAPAIAWIALADGAHASLPARGEWLVTVETDSGREVHVLEHKGGNKWMHEGEFTFQHSYFFRPIAWAPRPYAYAGKVPE